MTKKSENKVSYQYYKVKRSDNGKFLAYSFFIEYQLKKHLPHVYKKYMEMSNLIKSQEMDFIDGLAEERNKIFSMTLKYLKNKHTSVKAYSLNGFGEMLFAAIMEITSQREINNKFDEKDCLRICYTNIEKFINSFPKKIQESHFRDRLYKISLLSGYISIQFGYTAIKHSMKLLNNGDPSAKAVSDAVISKIRKISGINSTT